jgi:hypothetical protein
MINTDEVSVQNKSNNPQAYAFRHAYEKYNKELVNQTDHVKPTISNMYWGGIWLQGRTPLVPMKRDPTSRKNGYTAWSYRLALRDGLLPYYDGTRRFQQDNAKIHLAHDTMTWLVSHGIELLEWPPNSPDLSPIENVWSLLKRKLQNLFPYLRDLKDNEADRAEFERCVQVAWQALDQAQIQKILRSLPDRLRACIHARGWYTKY